MQHDSPEFQGLSRNGSAVKHHLPSGGCPDFPKNQSIKKMSRMETVPSGGVSAWIAYILVRGKILTNCPTNCRRLLPGGSEEARALCSGPGQAR